MCVVLVLVFVESCCVCLRDIVVDMFQLVTRSTYFSVVCSNDGIGLQSENVIRTYM